MAPEVLSFSNKDIQDIAAQLRADLEKGLSKEEAGSRLSTHGFNETKVKETTWQDIFLRQLKTPFTYLLAVAALIAFVIGNTTDALVIVLIVVLNTIIGFYQEWKSDQALRTLEKYISVRAKVRRGGSRTRIPAREVVPGDILLLQTGDVVPADARIIKAEGLVLNETTLTGESVPVGKTEDAISTEVKGYYQATNMVFSGTVVTSGSAVSLVVATGDDASAGSLIHLAGKINKESEFAKGLGRFSAFIIRLVAITIAFIFTVNLLLKGGSADVGDLLVFALALAVSVIPEALPVVSVFSLSRGALRLAKRKVIAKRLSAIEDLGGIEILCTDKTGTLTENKLRVVETFPKENKEAVFYGYIGSPFLGGVSDVDPFDLALGNALKDDEKGRVKEFTHVKEVPFDPLRKRNVVVVRPMRGEEDTLQIISRGAPETLLAMCHGVSSDAKTWAEQQGTSGRRVLAVVKKSKKGSLSHVAEEVKGFEFVGLIAFEDPIKDTAQYAVERARKLGVEIKILTGDAPDVAAAVAKRVGLIKGRGEVMLGEELIELSLEEQRARVASCPVFARVSPEQKYHIVSLLREKASVGFLGEGINDAPVLNAASVSLVVESASDVTRGEADIILLDKSLATIIEGLQIGRTVFVNTLKYIRATLASNFGNFYAVAISSLFIEFLPLLPVQILLINLLSDFPMISIAADSVDRGEIARPQKYNVRDIALLATVLGIVSTVFDFLFFALYYKISPEVLQTNWFMASIITELLFLYSVRTRKFFLKGSRPAPIILWLSGSAFVTTLILPFTKWGQEIFHFITPQPVHVATILGIAAVYFVVTETVKLLYYKYSPSGNTGR